VNTTGGEAHQILPEHNFRRLCGDFHSFVCAFHLGVYLSFEIRFSPRIALRLVQAVQLIQPPPCAVG
jgi:hypothetical protein